MRKKTKRSRLRVYLSILLSMAMLMTGSIQTAFVHPEAAKAAETMNLANPRVKPIGVCTWECVYFGKYWQNDTNGDGKVDRNDEKEPIKWRVLSKSEDDMFLLADQGLDCQPYNTVDESVTWETCTLRSWLNGYGGEYNAAGKDYSDDNFIDAAFSSDEQELIRKTDVVNEINPEYDTEGGNDTRDLIYLLSMSEVTNPDYGFPSGFSSEEEGYDSLYMENTAYANEKEDTSTWWLRSPGYINEHAASVTNGGYGDYGWGDYVTDKAIVRPVLHLNRNTASSFLYSSAGTVSSMEDISTTWDCIYFGSYWQNDTNGDGVVNQEDEKQPIKWRLLSVNGNDALLLADQNLDCIPVSYDSVTWETCMLRSWLNGYDSASNVENKDCSSNNFIDAAFSTAEQEAIEETNLVNKNDLDFLPEGENDTKDHLFLLSIAELSVPEYGFYYRYRWHSGTRIATNTAFAKEHGAYTTTFYTDLGSGAWWLRSPGHLLSPLADIDDGGFGCYGWHENPNIGNDTHGIRPALYLNLSCSDLYSYAGTVTSENFKGESAPITIPKPLPTNSPSAVPDIPTTKPTVTPKPLPTNSTNPVPGTPTATPTASPEPLPSGTPVIIPDMPTEVPDDTTLNQNDSDSSTISDKKSNASYKILSDTKSGGTISFQKPLKKAAKVTVPATITSNGKKYKVTSIAAKAFKNDKKLKQLTVGKNVKSIGKEAFSGCKKLKKIVLQTSKLTNSSVGKKAFTGVHKKVKVKVPKKKLKTYRKILKKKGMPRTARYRNG